jgi:hypothetical protein
VTSLYQKRSLILFTDKGVLEQKPDGWELLISQKEMVKNGRSMAEEAGRATGTIPGILTGFRCITPKRDLLLYDGVFSKEGPYLIDPIVDAKLFGYSKENILVFNVGEDEESWITKIQDLLYFLICRECYLPKSPDGHKQGVLAICPKIAEFSSVNFWVGEYAKLRALIKGYAATVETLNKEGLLTAQMFARAVKIIAEANALHRRTRWMKWCFLGKLRARKMKELLARHGMYDLGETS